MDTVFRLKADDLDQTFLESVKMLFHGKEVEIFVTEVDETAYLSRSDVNRMHLLRAIENVDNGKNLVEVDLSEL